MSKCFREDVNLEYSQTGRVHAFTGWRNLEMCDYTGWRNMCNFTGWRNMLIRWSLNKMCHVKVFL